MILIREVINTYMASKKALTKRQIKSLAVICFPIKESGSKSKRNAQIEGFILCATILQSQGWIKDDRDFNALKRRIKAKRLNPISVRKKIKNDIYKPQSDKPFYPLTRGLINMPDRDFF